MKSNSLPVGFAVALVAATAAFVLSPGAHAQAPAAKPGAVSETKAGITTKSQSELANPKVSFATVAETDAKVKAAVDSHNLAGAKALIGKGGALTGTVTGIYAPKSNKIVILNFDHDYKTAVSVIVEASSFSKFPDLNTLTGKKVVVTGKFIAFKTGAELMISSPSDVKIIK